MTPLLASDIDRHTLHLHPSQVHDLHPSQVHDHDRVLAVELPGGDGHIYHLDLPDAPEVLRHQTFTHTHDTLFLLDGRPAVVWPERADVTVYRPGDAA